VGVTYYRPGTGWAPQVWKKFDAEATRRDFFRMKQWGVNCVRVFLSYGSFFKEPDALCPEGLAKFDQFLAAAEAAGIYVHPTGPDHWEGMPAWASGDRIADDRVLAALETFWKRFVERSRGRSVIFAYDLLNEPEVPWDTPAVQAKWNAWLQAHYGTADHQAAAWHIPREGIRWGQQPSPAAKDAAGDPRLLDFQHFRESLADAWTRCQAKAVKAADPQALVTVGMIQWSVPALLPGVRHYAAFRPQRQAEFLDFLEAHFYPLESGFFDYSDQQAELRNLAYLESVAREVAAPGKPVVVAEFGWYGGGKLTIDQGRHAAATEEQQSQWCSGAIQTTRGLATGWLNWGFYDQPEARDVSQLTGLLTSDAKPKAWARDFRRLAGALAGRALPRKRLGPRPILEWDRCLVSTQAGHQFREEYFKAFLRDHVDGAAPSRRVIPSVKELEDQFPRIASLSFLAAGQVPSIRPVAPHDKQVLEGFLTARIAWEVESSAHEAASASPVTKEAVRVAVTEASGLRRTIADVRLPADRRELRLAVRPGTSYVWQITPIAQGVESKTVLRGSFTSGNPRIDATADDRVRYRNPRRGAHYQQMGPISPGIDEPLSPWYAVKKYQRGPPPTFDQIRGKLPEPVWEGHPDALDAYWYCWKTLCGVWSYAPKDADHQAVANLIGIRSWGPWGSTMVFDTAFITYFARYAHAAYPFIEGFDNCYARQHENGFICRESDRENREVYVVFPVNPPLFAWAEWEYYRLSDDARRLEAVFLPIVKHYEWWMTYQRRPNGLYWTNGAQEADDSPRNAVMQYAVSATSYQALAALYLGRIARAIGRDDMAAFFDDQHRQLGELVNRHFWDAGHRIYNDLAADGRFITELEPKKLCKHCHMFWPMLAEVAPSDRIDGMVAELTNPASFGRRNGVPSLSADSAGYTGGPEGTGQYWRGAVWPPIQCMVQEGLRRNGRSELARQIAEKYSAAVVETYRRQHDIRENLAPDRPLACGVGKFVGWGGVGPVANLIEYLLGFDVDAPANKIVWRIACIERHGLKDLRLGRNTVTMLCERRPQPDAPCRFTVSAAGDFTLVVITDREMVEKKLTAGHHELVVK